MPFYRVEATANVRRFYEIEAADEKQAMETYTLNEPVDEQEIDNETVLIVEISGPTTGAAAEMYAKARAKE